MDLTTEYLGMSLSSPLVASASPASGNVENIKKMEDAGISAVVLQSLFEEQLRHDQFELHYATTQGTYSSPEALTYFPEWDDYKVGPEEYLNLISKAKESVSIPIIASLNGTSKGSWTEYAKKMQEAGADAIELNIYYIPGDINISGAETEQNYIDILKSVKSVATVPVAVKVSPYFSNTANMAKRFAEAGANGLVLFNRFYQPDVDLEELVIKPKITLSPQSAMLVPLTWIGMLKGKLNISFAATGGIHTGEDALKMLMVGSDVTMMASAILKNGISYISTVKKEIIDWMEKKEYESVKQLKGSMSQEHTADPAAYERAQYMKAITSYQFINS